MTGELCEVGVTFPDSKALRARWQSRSSQLRPREPQEATAPTKNRGCAQGYKPARRRKKGKRVLEATCLEVARRPKPVDKESKGRGLPARKRMLICPPVRFNAYAKSALARNCGYGACNPQARKGLNARESTRRGRYVGGPKRASSKGISAQSKKPNSQKDRQSVIHPGVFTMEVRRRRSVIGPPSARHAAPWTKKNFVRNAREYETWAP